MLFCFFFFFSFFINVHIIITLCLVLFLLLFTNYFIFFTTVKLQIIFIIIFFLLFVFMYWNVNFDFLLFISNGIKDFYNNNVSLIYEMFFSIILIKKYNYIVNENWVTIVNFMFFFKNDLKNFFKDFSYFNKNFTVDFNKGYYLIRFKKKFGII